MENDKKCRWVSELVGDEYKDWKPGLYGFSAGTGQGKTTFIIRKLAPYAKTLGRRVLYLSNRERLDDQTYKKLYRAGLYDVIDVMTYQRLETLITQNEEIPTYDYYVCDECHYWTSDALFNPATDVSYDYIMEKQDSMILLMSATARQFFGSLLASGSMAASHLYYLEQPYEYVDEVRIYDSRSFFTLIDKFLDDNPGSKVVAFVNEKRMVEAHKKYGDEADYICSKYTRSDKLKKICGITETEVITSDGRNRKERNVPNILNISREGDASFDKRLLFTTKVMDNGVSLVDRSIKAVFCEILDPDSMMQCLGRKRSLGPDDRCVFYIKRFQSNWIQGSANRYKTWLTQADLLMQDREKFETTYEKPHMRDIIKKNRILYTAPFMKVNMRRYDKCKMDVTSLMRMLEIGHTEAIKEIMGESLAAKIVVDDTKPFYEDELMEYLDTISPEEKLFKDIQNEIREKFKGVGLNLDKVPLKGKRSAGISALNGVLESRYGENFPRRFTNKTEDGKPLREKKRVPKDDGTESMRDKCYWLLC